MTDIFTPEVMSQLALESPITLVSLVTIVCLTKIVLRLADVAKNATDKLAESNTSLVGATSDSMITAPDLQDLLPVGA